MYFPGKSGEYITKKGKEFEKMTDEARNVAAANEIRRFWTGILRDSESDMKDKLKVSELLAKDLGVFCESREEEPKEEFEKMTLKEKLSYIEKLKES